MIADSASQVKRICSVCGMTEPPSWRRSLLTPAKIVSQPRVGLESRLTLDPDSSAIAAVSLSALMANLDQQIPPN